MVAQGVESHQLAQDRGRRHVRADLFEHHGRLDPAQSDAAEVLGDGEGAPALIDHRRPERGIRASAALHGGPRHRHRRPSVEQIGGRLGQCLLVVGELEVHGRRA